MLAPSTGIDWETNAASSVASQRAEAGVAHGALVLGEEVTAKWDPIVLGNAKYDFVEVHFYPEVAGREDDAFLLTQAPQQFAQSLAKVRAELAAVGRPATPIMVGEFNSVNANPGKQSVSVVNGLYMGMALSEILRAGASIATMNVAFTSCGEGNQSLSLYGWQNFGSYDLFSPGTPGWAVGPCPNAQATAFGTPFPNARAYELAMQFAHPSEHMLGTSLLQVPNVRAYAATQGAGYALFLFNLDKNNPVTISVSVAHATALSFTSQASPYGKAQYDQTQNGNWVGAVTTPLGSVGTAFSITLPPWSMTVVQLVSAF